MRNSFQLVLFLICVVIVPVVRAEFICSGELSYTWRAEKSDSDQSVPWIRIEQTGPDEESAKSKLTLHLAGEKNKARASCKQVHENSAQCVASKFAVMEPIFQKQSFTGRKALEEAITKDCAKGDGVCKDIVASDPKCTEIKNEEAGAAADAKKEAGKKDAKGKK